ncbi:hypothetical protein PCANC_03460 [Puccinia coronata f. sp. avenae]|uniref:Uncharacterized protein n=1 Tax=Puccinia coronata f. sp. avenae TaxID=200324 RepID=A0A2N5W2D0_9BASI|nr:hypothetical protein PCANC_03460 [Puccinia coronata f. sp. avenae]
MFLAQKQFLDQKRPVDNPLSALTILLFAAPGLSLPTQPRSALHSLPLSASLLEHRPI